MDLYLAKFPDFHGETMSDFSSYAIDLLIQTEQNPVLIEEIFRHIEFLMIHGDEEVQTAAATCFLENILNVTPTQIDPKRFVSYLGPESREYCRAWDDFTGVKTEGV